MLRFYADLSMWDEKDPKMGYILASIETSNEGLYFGDKYANQIDTFLQGEYQAFSWSQITNLVADLN